MAPRLKVFITSDGLTDYVVAVSSKPKALAAWGSHQDLFQTGAARETDDPELVEAASARPGEVIRRVAGAREALAKLPAVKRPKAPKPVKARTPEPEPEPPKAEAPAKARKPPRPEKPPGPSKAQLKQVARLEERLADLQAEHRRERQVLDAKFAALEERRGALEARQNAELARLEEDLKTARRALG